MNEKQRDLGWAKRDIVLPADVSVLLCGILIYAIVIFRFNALMVTDVLSKGTDLLVAGDAAAVARALGEKAHDSEITLPGVMSRKKQVAPKLLALL